jgi:uncharacterized protein YdaU (DUF1376 family)
MFFLQQKQEKQSRRGVDSMSARPWMPLYIDAYLADTGHLSVVEHGAYLLLIMHYWKNGGLPEDERMIARVARLSPEQWAESRDVLAMLFGDGWRHKRIDEELAKADDIISKRKNAARAMHDARAAQAEQVHGTCNDTRVPPSTLVPDTSPSVAIAPSGVTRGQAWPRDAFDQFWKRYPAKVGKGAAEKAFAKARAGSQAPPFAALLDSLDAYIRHKPPDREWCHPTTWLNQGRWNDEWTDAGQPQQQNGTRRQGGSSDRPTRTGTLLAALAEQCGSTGGDDFGPPADCGIGGLVIDGTIAGGGNRPGDRRQPNPGDEDGDWTAHR